MTRSSTEGEADAAFVNRRLVVMGTLALGTGLAARGALADQISPSMTKLAVSEGGFRFIPEPGSPFSAGVASLPTHTLIRIRLRAPLPFEQGLDLVVRHLAGADRQPSALALSGSGNPSFATVTRIAHALGLKITLSPAG